MWEAETDRGISPFAKSLMYWDTVFHRDGKGFQGAERTMCKALRSWWRDKYIYRAKTVPMTTKCKRVHCQVYSTVLNGSVSWPWSGAMINKVRAWEAQILRLTSRPRMRPAFLQNKNIAVPSDQLEENELVVINSENCE